MAETNDAPFDDELLSAYLDDELSGEERAHVEERLASDSSARQLLDELRSVSRAMKSLPHETLGDDMRESVLRRAERAMLVADDASARSGRVEVAHRIPFGRSKRAWFWAGTALAAGLMLMFIERAERQDAGIPREVALNRPVAEAPSEPRTPLAMRALETRGEDLSDTVSTVPPLAEASGVARGGSELSSAEPEAVSDRERGLDVVARSSRPGGAGGIAAGFEARESAIDESGGDKALVVRLNLTPVAMQNRVFDATLLNNRIEVEKEAELAQLADDLAKPVAAKRVEVVLVEAEPAQVYSTLAEIKADTTNYLGIAVEPQHAIANSSPAKRQWGADVQKYSRGRVSQQQIQFTQDDRYFYLLTDQDRYAVGRPMAEQSPARAVERGTLSFDSSAAGQPTTLSAAPTPQQSQPIDKIKQQLARRALQKLEAPADTLQVMFVLQSEQVPATTSGPAAQPTSAPASGESPTIPEGLNRDK